MQPEPYSIPPFALHPLLAPHRRGAIVWITGLAATGKSRLASALSARLTPVCPVELLDGDEVHRHLLDADGSRASRSKALARLGFTARMLARHGVIAIAPVTALDEGVRADVRSVAEAEGVPFLEVFVEADLDALIEAGARASDRTPPARPHAPDVTIRLDWQSLDDSLDRIVGALASVGAVGAAFAAGT